MGKAAKWLRSLFTGKDDKDKCVETRSGPIPMSHPPQEKKRLSFRRSVTRTTMVMEKKSEHVRMCLDSDISQKRQVANAAAIRLRERAAEAVEEVAAIKIQSVFRSYLARKALCALKGLVKLQALIRGHLVRNQTVASFRSMQAMVTAQARARIQRLLALEEAQAMSRYKQHIYKRPPYEMDDNVKIVEMDLGELKGSSKNRNNIHSLVQTERRDNRLATYSGNGTPHIREPNREVSPARSTYTERRQQAYSGHLGENLSTSSINDLTDYHLFPNYMAKTESSRAKARSHSAPKQRSDSCERQPSKGRPSIDGKSVSKGFRHPCL